MTVKTATSPAFEALLADLNTMAKAIDVEKEEIAEGRKDEKHMQHGDKLAKSEAEKIAKEKKEKEEEEEEERKKKEGKGKEKEHEMAKSFSIKLENGETIEVQDAAAMLKSLSIRLDGTEQKIFATLEGAANVIKSQGALLKSFSEELVAQKAATTEQAELVKSLKADLDKIGSAPGGRKAVLSVTERRTGTSTEVLAKSGIPEGVSPETFFAKAFEKQGQGKITGTDISLAETCINSGIAIPDAIVSRVLA